MDEEFVVAAVVSNKRDHGEECSGIDTTKNVSHKNTMEIFKYKHYFAVDIDYLYQNASKYIHIYARVAFLSLTIILVINQTKKKRRISTTKKSSKSKLKSARAVLENLVHLRAVFNATAVGVVAIDQQKLVSYMNVTAARMCGVRTRAAVGRPVAEVVRLGRGARRSDLVSRLQDFSTNCFALDSTYILRSLDCNKRSIRIQLIVSPLTVRGKQTGTVVLLKDVSASFKLMKKLAKSASYDQLTGLPNRRSFEMCLKEAVNGLAGCKAKHALVFLDLDGFKAVNDSAGHAAGDALLKEIARLLQSKLRHSDFLARLAGDEFGLILFDCELAHAKSLMDVVVDNVLQHNFYWEGKMLRVGASAGIVSIDCAGASTSELLARADAACYDAKHRGKGQARIFEQY